MNPPDIRRIDRKRLAALFDFAVKDDDPETAPGREESEGADPDSAQAEDSATDSQTTPPRPRPDHP